MVNKTLSRWEEVLVNFYNWSLDDARRGVNDGFSLIKDIKGTGIHAYQSYLSSTPLEKRQEIAQILVKRCNLRAAELCGETFSDSEKVEVQKFLDFYIDFSGKELFNNNDSIYGKRNPQKIDKVKLSKIIKSNLLDICGEYDSKSSKVEWTHRLKFEDWTVLTTIRLKDFGSQIRYNHTFINENIDEIETRLIDVMRWLGVTETEWNRLAPGDEEIAGLQLARVCSYFIQSLPKILN